MINLSDILKSRVWRYLQNFARHTFQSTMFQPVGGMDAIGKAFAREVGDVIQYDAKVTRIQQDDRGVTVTYTNLKRLRQRRNRPKPIGAFARSRFPF